MSLEDKLGNMSQMRYEVMTVSSLVAKLAGMPPMMEIYIDAEGTPMFLNEVEIEDIGQVPPFLRLICGVHPKKLEADRRPYEEKLDEQKQRAMHMGSEIEKNSKMHPMVD